MFNNFIKKEGVGMNEKTWKFCLDCKEAVYDQEEESCFKCGGSAFEEIALSKLQEMREGNPKSGIVIKTRRWGNIYNYVK